jgi:hypothetical protein
MILRKRLQGWYNMPNGRKRYKGTMNGSLLLIGQGTESWPCKDGVPPSSNKSTTTHVWAVTMIKLSKYAIMHHTISLYYGWWPKVHIAWEHHNPTVSVWVPEIWDQILFTDDPLMFEIFSLPVYPASLKLKAGTCLFPSFIPQIWPFSVHGPNPVLQPWEPLCLRHNIGSFPESDCTWLGTRNMRLISVHGHFPLSHSPLMFEIFPYPASLKPEAGKTPFMSFIPPISHIPFWALTQSCSLGNHYVPDVSSGHSRSPIFRGGGEAIVMTSMQLFVYRCIPVYVWDGTSRSHDTRGPVSIASNSATFSEPDRT